MHLIFLYDDCTDELDPSGSQEWANITLDAIENPNKPRPEDEPFIGECFRQ